jgi:hypothetical protein
MFLMRCGSAFVTELARAWRWAEAVVAACDEVGVWVDVHVNEMNAHDPLTRGLFTLWYSWECSCTSIEDLDEYIETHKSRGCYDAFHRACLVCESLRPPSLTPSPKLIELLRG